MNADQQFIVAMGGILASIVVSALGFWRSGKAVAQAERTHDIVNHQLDEWKRQYLESSRQAGRDEAHLERAESDAAGAKATHERGQS